MRKATYSVSIGSSFSGQYGHRKDTVSLDSVNSVLADITEGKNTHDIFSMPKGKTLISTREGAENDKNVYIYINTSHWFRVEPELRDALDGFGATHRKGAKHMRYIFAKEKDPHKEFLESI